MKKFLSVLLAAGVLLFMTSCDKDKGTVDLNYVVTYDRQPIVYGDTYDFADGVKLQFDNIKFFVSNVQLEESDGGATTLSELDFLVFDNAQNATLAAEGKTISVNEVPVEEYSGIHLNIGLTKALNDIKPADADSDSPLLDGNYWSNWGSYIFFSISGKADLDKDGVFEHNLVYHIGGEESIVTKSFNKNINVTGGSTSEVKFEFDLKEAFMPNGVPFNIEDVSQLHTDRVIMADFAEKLSNSLELK